MTTTMQSSTLDQLAVLVAVERQASTSREARRIEADKAFTAWTRDIHNGDLKHASRDADAARDAAARALVHARADVDDALAVLGGIEVTA